MDLNDVRALVNRGHLIQALDAALHFAEQAADPVDQIEGWLIACRCAAGRGLYARAHQFAQRALGLAEGIGDRFRIALARLHAGKAYLASGSAVDAEEHLLEFLSALPDLPELEPQRAIALYHLALSYDMRRRVEPAVSTYRDAARLFEEQGRRSEAAKARQNAAWLLQKSSNVDEAEQELMHARLLVVDGEPVEQANQIVLEAYLNYRAGHKLEAMAAAEEILTPGRPGVTPWSRCCAACIAGNIALDEGNRDLARVMLEEALRESPECQDSALMNMVTELKRRVEQSE